MHLIKPSTFLKTENFFVYLWMSMRPTHVFAHLSSGFPVLYSSPLLVLHMQYSVMTYVRKESKKE